MESIDNVLEQIQSHPLFLRLKNVIENADGWHDHEDVLSHSIKVLREAKNQLSGNFITNVEAKRLFMHWSEQDIHGTKQKDLSLLIALIHDCGKILHFKEGNEEKTLVSLVPNKPGWILCPGHEYWGAKIVVPELLKDITISGKAKEYVAKVIKDHGYFHTSLPSKKDWSTKEVMYDVKARSEGLYIEALFNTYCDGYTASAFAEGKKRTEELFNAPEFYIPREYFIPEN